MNATRSHIRMLPPSERIDGTCAICELPVHLKFRDDSSGYLLGDCCLHATINAERVLSNMPTFRQPQDKK